MAKFKINLQAVVEAGDVDEAVTRAAIYLAINASAKRPMLNVPPQDLFNFPAERNINVLEEISANMFKSQHENIHNVILNVEPNEAFPAPEGVM